MPPNTGRHAVLDHAGLHAGQPDGFVDCHLYHPASQGWWFCGWVRQAWQGAAQIVAGFETGELAAPTRFAFFHRGDLPPGALGVVLFAAAAERPAGRLQSLRLETERIVLHLQPATEHTQRHPAEATPRIQAGLQHAYAGPDRAALQRLIARRDFDGSNTMGSLGALRIGLDDTFACPPDGVLLHGWMAATPDAVQRLSLCCGPRRTEIDLRNAIRLPRPDVVAALPQYGDDLLRCGFLAFVPDALVPGHAPYLEAETGSGEIGQMPLPPSLLRGVPAMRWLLGLFDEPAHRLDHAFDRVIGPAMRSINTARLQALPPPIITQFGQPPDDPLASLVVPLYGRVDFLEYQMALFSMADHGATDLIYVLDDPDRSAETHALAASVFARFAIPFRIIEPAMNLGFAPASNLGLQHARGAYVCFLNSDVFPDAPDWLPRLIAQLDAEPGLGVVGPLLLFEDGSVQHQGIVFENLPGCADWAFPVHVRKGRKPEATGGLRRHAAITGACMVMRHAEARALGGFCTDYVIGDFEDSDLCLRIAARGQFCAVDGDVAMHHLERRSQADPAQLWRRNLSLHNAWRHQRRWFAA